MSKKRVSLEDRINKPIASAITAFTTNNESKSVEEADTKVDTDNVTKNEQENKLIDDTEKVTEQVTENNNNTETKKVTKSKTKNETKNVTKNESSFMQTKAIKIGNMTFKSIYKGEEELKRSAYYLREDTIDKIEKCAKLAGYKKAEFVDFILNSILTDIINKVDK